MVIPKLTLHMARTFHFYRCSSHITLGDAGSGGSTMLHLDTGVAVGAFERVWDLIFDLGPGPRPGREQSWLELGLG